MLTGTLFYWRFEDWSFIEALYFCVVTLTTVGYGDLSPTTDGTRIFTIVYILTGFGVLVALLTSVAQQYITQKAERGGVRGRRRARRERDAAADEIDAEASASERIPRCPDDRTHEPRASPEPLDSSTILVAGNRDQLGNAVGLAPRTADRRREYSGGSRQWARQGRARNAGVPVARSGEAATLPDASSPHREIA